MTTHTPWLCGALLFLASSCLSPVNDTPLGSVDAGPSGGGTAMTGGGMGGGTATGGGNTTPTGGGGGGVTPPLGCTTDGFCWERSTFGGTFHGIAGVSPTFVVAVGEGGVIAHYDGTRWAMQRPAPGKTLRGVWFESATRGWAVGEGGTLLEWNGTSWSQLTSPTPRDLTAIHGAGSTVYVGGHDVLLTRGTSGFVVVPGALPVTDSIAVVRGISVVAPNDVFIAGTGTSFVRHFDGTQWTELISPAGASGGPTSSDSPYGLSVCGDTVFVSGSYSGEANVTWARVNGAWSELIWQSGGRVLCLSPTEYLTFGSTFYSSRTVTRVTLGTPSNSVELASDIDVHAAWVAGPSEVWLVGENGALLHWTGTTLTVDAAQRTQRVFAFSATNVWIVRGDKSVARFDGTSWQTVAIPNAAGDVLALYSPSPDEVWVIRGAQVFHLKNNVWDFNQTLPAGTSHITGTGANNVWFSGGVGVVQQYDGTRLLSHFLPASNTTGPMHVTATQTWVPTYSDSGVGSSYRFTGTTWQSGPLAWRIGGFGDELYVADVTALSRLTLPSQVTSVATGLAPFLLAATSDALFVVKTTYVDDTRATVVRVRNSVATPLDSGASEALSWMSASPDGHLWMTTVGGGLLHKRP